MKEVPDDMLIDAYLRSLEIGLDEDFISILYDELTSRSIVVDLPPFYAK